MIEEFSQARIEVVRKIILFMIETKTLSRKYICDVSGIKPAQFDNFTKMTPDKKRYKSVTPDFDMVSKLVYLIKFDPKFVSETRAAISEEAEDRKELGYEEAQKGPENICLHI